jgi:hypothetical protein
MRCAVLFLLLQQIKVCISLQHDYQARGPRSANMHTQEFATKTRRRIFLYPSTLNLFYRYNAIASKLPSPVNNTIDSILLIWYIILFHFNFRSTMPETFLSLSFYMLMDMLMDIDIKSPMTTCRMYFIPLSDFSDFVSFAFFSYLDFFSDLVDFSYLRPRVLMLGTSLCLSSETWNMSSGARRRRRRACCSSSKAFAVVASNNTKTRSHICLQCSSMIITLWSENKSVC